MKILKSKLIMSIEEHRKLIDKKKLQSKLKSNEDPWAYVSFNMGKIQGYKEILAYIEKKYH